jgi:hypothetical protein
MRNFDFAIQHYSSISQLIHSSTQQHCRTSFRHLGYRTCFQVFHLDNICVPIQREHAFTC